jgi:hypothetical protein
MTAGAGAAARQVTTSRPFQLVARIGLIIYGVVHLLVAWLAVQVAIGDGGKADKAGALQSLGSGAGVWLLWLIAAGLGATALWQLTEAVAARGRGGEVTRHRLTYLGEAVLFGYLAFSAGKIAAGAPTSSTDQVQRGLIGQLLAETWGQAVVVLLGVGVLLAALFVIRHGLSKRFLRHMDVRPEVHHAVVRLGQIGYTALGVVYGIAGVLVIIAALNADPAQATGLDVALKTLAAQSYGPVLLILIAAGLSAFGIVCFFDARYRHTR